jgi:hypothetical protein
VPLVDREALAPPVVPAVPPVVAVLPPLPYTFVVDELAQPKPTHTPLTQPMTTLKRITDLASAEVDTRN